VNHFLEVILPVFGFNFFCWMTGELARKLHGDFSLPLMDLLLILWLAFFPEKPGRVLKNGRMQD
jgi:hypothetical protein